MAGYGNMPVAETEVGRPPLRLYRERVPGMPEQEGPRNPVG